MRLTLEELERVADLWAVAWGRNNKTWIKLDKAIQRRKARSKK